MNDNDRLEILELLANQKISAQEAADMLRQGDLAASADESVKVKTTADNADPVYKAESQDETADEPEIEMMPWSNDTLKSNGKKPNWLRIRVRDLNSDRNKVTVNIPLALVSFGLGAARRFGADMGGVDTEMVLEMIKHGERGILVDVQDEEDGEHVQIYLD